MSDICIGGSCPDCGMQYGEHSEYCSHRERARSLLSAKELQDWPEWKALALRMGIHMDRLASLEIHIDWARNGIVTFKSEYYAENGPQAF